MKYVIYLGSYEGAAKRTCGYWTGKSRHMYGKAYPVCEPTITLNTKRFADLEEAERELDNCLEAFDTVDIASIPINSQNPRIIETEEV